LCVSAAKVRLLCSCVYLLSYTMLHTAAQNQISSCAVVHMRTYWSMRGLCECFENSSCCTDAYRSAKPSNRLQSQKSEELASLDDEKCFFFQTDQEGYMESCTETLFMQHITRPLLPRHPLSFHSRPPSLTHGIAWHGSFQHLSSIVRACALCQQLQQSPDHLYLCHRVRTRQGR
jgi:hypothetical protein